MATTYKDILITPFRGDANNNPYIRFSSGDATTNADMNVWFYATTNGTLSFEGSAGQLFSITNDLTGTIFSVNDVSGIPSLEIDANGKITLAQFGGNVGIGTSNAQYKLDVAGTANINGTLLVLGSNVIAAIAAGNTYAGTVGDAANTLSLTRASAANGWANTVASASAVAANTLSATRTDAANGWANTISATRTNAANGWANTVASASADAANTLSATRTNAANGWANTVASASAVAANTLSATRTDAANGWANTISATRTNSANGWANTVASASAVAANSYATTVGAGANSYANTTFVKLTAPNQTITGDISITGNLNVLGNVTTIGVDNLVINDPVILLANNNTTDITDLGFVAHYANATSAQVHTGLIRDPGTKQWYLFKEYNDHFFYSNGNIDISGNNFTIDTLNTNIITSNLVLGGANAILTISAAFNIANASNGWANTVASTSADAANTLSLTRASAANGWANTISATRTNAANGWANTVASASADAANTLSATRTNAANGWANTVSSAAFTQANTARNHANAAFEKANTAGAYFQGNNGDVGSATGLGDIFRVHTNTLTANVTIYSGNNALAAGPITIQSGKSLTIQDNARVAIV